MTKQSKTTQLVMLALLITMEIILTRLCSIFMPTTLRIGIGFLPIAIAGILYGPFWGGIAYAAGDLIGMLLFPAGPYFPGFTLTAFLTGAVFGLVLHNKEITWQRTIVASSIIVIFLNLLLDTYWLYLLFDQAVIGMLPLRILKCVITLGMQTTLIPLVWNRCIVRTGIIKPASGISK